ncbi:hypothetical protein NIES2101_26395 [Calothrix sp. HK-06]|nr:hypothetical protein NIES2101_26395 [Calothrix sp. HK-06]
MSRNRKSAKTIQKLYKIISGSVAKLRKLLLLLLRTFVFTKRKPRSANAGFVLPTVAMVSIVVVLLTVAIMFRSFERSKNASNVRVNQVILNATTPAIDRARAKLNALSEDPTLPRGTPSDGALYDALKRDKYRFGDESRLKLAYDFNGISGIQKPGDPAPSTGATDTNPRVDTIEEDETSKTAWRFAIDTDNDGKKDTFTLYGINFRSPSRNTSGEFNRKRNPLEARTPPMDNDATNQQCRNAAGFSTLVGNSSWYKLQNGNLGKSFFVYAVNVPITEQQMQNESLSTSEFEPYTGNKGFAAIEFQQDRSRIPLPNNAVWYENDLEITPGVNLALNGRIHTNGNLLIGGGTNPAATISLRQVSSKTSCFYNQENGLITVGGNVGTGSVAQNTNQSAVNVHLYSGYNVNPNMAAVINSTNRSTDQAGGQAIGFNDNAYNQRISRMKTTAEGLCPTCMDRTANGQTLKQRVNDSTFYPDDIKRNVSEKVKNTDDGQAAVDIIRDEIEVYLRNRTRRVPFAEVAADASETTATSAFNATTFAAGQLQPPQAWREPLNASNNLNGSSNPVVTLNTSQLSATFPDLQKQEGVQTSIGDRVLVGNNLPALWLQGSRYVGANVNQLISGVNWNRPTGGGAKQRWRNTQVQAIADLGISDRNGFWEQKAYERPVNSLDAIGGVRIITGAGIYRDDDRDGSGNPLTTGTPVFSRSGTITAPNSPALITEPPRLSSHAITNNPPQFNAQANIYVWPDTMRMSSAANPASNAKGDLLMRATAVYHYSVGSGANQDPIACVSSYYDPTNSTSITNASGLPWNATANGKSNNGIVYTYQGRTTLFTATNRQLLERQARLVFPNGRIVNQPLRDALSKFTGTTIPTTLQPSDYSAIDTALCAIQILNSPTSNIVTSGAANMPPHGAIREASFLDAREVKQIGRLTSASFANLGTADTSATSLDLEQRQPLEIRTTDIDLGQLASTTVTGGEYFLPNSGIIYASRDDAMRDSSDTSVQSELLSPTDYRLDPTRRSNGIRLINGATLARNPSVNNNTFNNREKGLILATNLPAYIRGAFNLHRTSTTSTTEIEEFTQASSASDTDFYNRSTPNTDFACRSGRTGCPGTGDYWRPATIIADSMTLLSQGFLDGFRSESDFDLNNNTGVPVRDITLSTTPINTTGFDTTMISRLRNGFLENSFVTNADWWRPGITGTNPVYPRNVNLHAPSTNPLGSYALNGVTPIQRRLNQGVPLYVMEICRQERVSDCSPGDWSVGFDINGDGTLSNTSQSYRLGQATTAPTVNLTERDIKTHQLGQAIIAARNLSTVTNGNPSSTTNNILTNSQLTWSGAPNGLAVSPTNPSIMQRLGAGHTGSPALLAADQQFPRRVAFARDLSNNLVQTGSGANDPYKPMGVGCPVRTTYSTPVAGATTPPVAEFRDNGCTYATGTLTAGTHYGILGNNGLWFRTVNDPAAIANPVNPRYDANSLFYYPPIDIKNNITGAAGADGSADLDAQPILVPVTQIIDARNTGNTLRNDDINQLQHEFRYNWINIATSDTTYNATFVVGNSPGRPAEIAAGLQNFVRFLEAWRTDTNNNDTSTPRIARISGSFIQLQRSKFATAPIGGVPRANNANTVNASSTANLAGSLSIFDFPNDTYVTPNGEGSLPFYWAPLRNWGFDVGLLSEQPDLFAQRFTQPQTGRPSEFFREVGRDDPWVQGLLCAGIASDKKGEAAGATYQVKAVGSGYLPSTCPTIPAD